MSSLHTSCKVAHAHSICTVNVYAILNTTVPRTLFPVLRLASGYKAGDETASAKIPKFLRRRIYPASITRRSIIRGVHHRQRTIDLKNSNRLRHSWRRQWFLMSTSSSASCFGTARRKPPPPPPPQQYRVYYETMTGWTYRVLRTAS